MSFQNKGFWMTKSAGFLNDGEMTYDNSSRTEPKRAHQWFIDATEPDLFPNKKQAIEAPNNKSISGLSSANVSPWENASSFQSVPGHFTDRLFGSETERTVNFGDRNISSDVTGNLNMGRKGIEDQFGNDSSVGLSISHAMEDPGSCLSYGGIRKVKVNQVKDSDNGMSVSMGHTYNRGDNNTIPMGLTFNRGDDNSMSMGHTYNKEDNSIISMGQAYSRGDDNIISMGHSYNKGDGNTISINQVYSKGDNNIISMGHSYGREDNNTISFGGFHDEPETNSSGRLISSYDLLMSQPSAQTSEALDDKALVELNDDGLVSVAQVATSGAKPISKNKMELKVSKKVAPNNFPSNVRSLISTGMLDGVPVKYISWSREKELRGFIKGSGYLCGCQSCNFSKTLNAFEFERHAGCKTKHPNNHIFFENGKTIYAIVQELRSTPQNLLFEVIQSVTGSPINQKSFRIWKGSSDGKLAMGRMDSGFARPQSVVIRLAIQARVGFELTADDRPCGKFSPKMLNCINKKRLRDGHNPSGWSELTPELLHLILKRLTLPDYLRFGAVCKSWRSIEIEKAHPPAPQFPWLMLRKSGYNANFSFFSLSEDRIYRLKLLEARGARCCGSSEGWLVMAHWKNLDMFLLNPFSKAQIQLPRQSSLHRANRIKKAIVVLTEPNCDHSNGLANLMVVMIYGDSSKLAFCRPGDETWTCFEDLFWPYSDIIFYNGKLYAIKVWMEMDVFIIDSPCPKQTLRINPPVNYGVRKYLAECHGDLLLVLRNSKERLKSMDPTLGFELFKLELDMSSPQFTCSTVNLGNQVLFLGINSSLSLQADNFPEFKGNHIYFTGNSCNSRDVGVFSLVDGSVKPFIPGDFSSIHPPMWITPKLF
ncbi:hypothetical protein HHK36_019010 [Tetracentron sinense]|uniref:F-box domain-containing protein n=1 Tax=Tetracentron sinense TaxID=13715 RepID=A0A834YWW2_TETSI|nr:hypothetical protein HHK36_019010 [Tetracentron sinense]